jgi:hypothetical protein
MSASDGENSQALYLTFKIHHPRLTSLHSTIFKSFMRLCGLLTSFNLRGPSPQPSHSFRVSRSRGKRASLETQQGEKSSPRRLYTALRTARPPLQA